MKGGNVSGLYNISNILKALVAEVVFSSRPLDKALESFFKNNTQISGYEKESLYKLFTFVVRYWITIHEIYKKQIASHNIDFNEILHLQHVLERLYMGKLVCKGAYEKQVLENFTKIEHLGPVRESYPEWLYNKILEEASPCGEKLIHNLNEVPPTVLRVNTLKTSPDILRNNLASKGRLVSAPQQYPHALQVNKYFDVFKCEEFQNGFFEIQDAGSQAIAPYLAIEPGMRIIDACAGNGGKTLHLSCLSENKGKIIALDTVPRKLETLRRRACRAGAMNIETRLIDSSKVIKRLANSADRLLLDVPCSGTGVIKRNPDIKYHLSEEKLEQLKLIQSDILDKYSDMTKHGGIMVYSTCSVLESENHAQVNKFIEKKQGAFELIDEKNISPLDGYDGFYMAKIRRIK